MKSINLTDDEAKELITFYSTKLEDAQAIVSRYKGLLDKLYKEHNVVTDSKQLKLVEDEDNGVITEFNSNWTWTQKIDFILKAANAPIAKKEVLNKLFVYEPSLGETKEQRQAAGRSIGATLSRQATNGRYVIIKTVLDPVNRYGLASK